MSLPQLPSTGNVETQLVSLRHGGVPRLIESALSLAAVEVPRAHNRLLLISRATGGGLTRLLDHILQIRDVRRVSPEHFL